MGLIACTNFDRAMPSPQPTPAFTLNLLNQVHFAGEGALLAMYEICLRFRSELPS